MTHVLNVYSLPRLVEPEQMAGGVAVVIDVLRASTTIVHALTSGAREVLPCVEVDDARAAAKNLPEDERVLGGERKGLPIDGFDYGNSPEDYTYERVSRKSVVFTTTNGTRAMQHARMADRVLIGAFVNVTAIVEELIGHEQIHLLCAGTNGQMGHDDVMLAGLLVERIQREGGLLYEQNAQAIVARETWLHAFALPRALGAEPLEPERLAGELRKSIGGRKLVALGMEQDILAAARIDHLGGVPELDTQAMRIRLA